MLVCALSFDSQLSCAFYLLNVFQFSQMFSLFPLLLIASSIFPALLLRQMMLGKKPIYGLDSHLSNQPARLPHIPCRPCKDLGTSQTNLLCSRKNQQHEPSHPQWTCCSPQKRIVCVPPCIKSRQHPKHFQRDPVRSGGYGRRQHWGNR